MSKMHTTMSRIAVLTLAFMACMSAVAADSKWTSPGWYQIEDTFVGPFLLAGPFGSQDACEATLPKNTEDYGYDCMYLDERPDWDD